MGVIGISQKGWSIYIFSELYTYVHTYRCEHYIFLGPAKDQQTQKVPYKNRSIGNVLAHDLIIKAVRAGALPKSKVLDVADQWASSDHLEFRDRNVNSLYNAFTEVYKGNLVALPNRSDALHSVLDSVVDFDIDNHVPNVIDVEVVENELVTV